MSHRHSVILSVIGLALATGGLTAWSQTAPAPSAPATPPPPPTPRPPAKPDPAIQKIVADVSEQRIHDIIAKLVGFGTRNTMSDPTQADHGVGAARQWIFDQFKGFSPKLQVSFDTHQLLRNPRNSRVFKDVEVRNVVAILPGKTPQAASRWIMITGHYDTINLRAEIGSSPAQAAEAIAPGACDDGSGTACVMECARVLSQYNFDATLVFVAFAGEEQGLIGATAMAKRLRSQNQEIEAVLNNDIIGTDTAGNGVKDENRVLVFSEDPDDSPSRALARFVHANTLRYFPEMTADMVFRYDRFARGGDHTPFNDEGYPAVRITTAAEDLRKQHTPEDTLANMSVPYTTRVVRINAAAAAALALAPKAPITSRAPIATTGRAGRAAAGGTATATAAGGGAAGAGGRNGRGGIQAGGVGLTRGGSGYDAVMRWDYPNPEPDLAGFVVVVRSTTAADWEKEYWAGNVRTFTLPNTPIDQVVIGVKAVDRDGHEGPVSAYVNTPRNSAPTAEAGQ